MSEPVFDVTAIGNALVDILSHTTDAVLSTQKMAKGGMMLINENRAHELYKATGPGVTVSGGSAGNTIAAFASFGGKGAYIGKVSNDEFGKIFKDDLLSLGVHFDTQPLAIGAGTGRCLILVTPDAQRTMNTFLGAAVELGPDDLDENLIASSRITYLEGYLFDPPQAKKAFYKAGELAHEAGHKIALTLSDTFCVDRHHADFSNLVQNHVDILFANEHEIKALAKTDDFDKALQAIRGLCDCTAITRSEKGSLIVTKEGVIEIEAIKPKQLVDTTGAGDAYAAGFLYGFTQGLSLRQSGTLGSIAATEVISHLGPRPEIKLSSLLPLAI